MKRINCPLCSNELSVRIAHGRTSNKLFIMLICAKDGRHFRGFISDQTYIKQLLAKQALKQEEKPGRVRGRVHVSS